jgi:ribonuclease HI
MHERKTVIFTDGSCAPNKTSPESMAGFAICFALGQFSNTVIYGNIANRPHYATSQRGEGTAIFRALQYLDEHKDKWDSVVIISDSDFWIKMFNIYMPSWEREETQFTEKKNSDLTVPMWDLYKKITMEYVKEVEFRHIKSHNKDNWGSSDIDSYEYFCFQNNKFVDEFANYARINLKPGSEVIDNVLYDEL